MVYSFEDLKYDIENVLDLHRQEFLLRGLNEDDLGSWEFVLEEKESEDATVVAVGSGSKDEKGN